MNAALGNDVFKLMESGRSPAEKAQKLSDLWWFKYHGQPHELPETILAVIQFYELREIDHALDALTRPSRSNRQGQQDGLPFEGDWDRDEWATEEIREGSHPHRSGPHRL